jgi:hypothetical protein
MMSEKRIHKWFYGTDGKLSWTAVGMFFGLGLVCLIVYKWLKDGHVDIGILEWSTTVIPMMIGVRAAQKGLMSMGGTIGSFASRYNTTEPEIETKAKKVASPGSKMTMKTTTTTTPHFSLQEFACSDGTPVPPEFIPRTYKLMQQLEVIREAFGGKKITISSGYRTVAYNAKVGGAINPPSRHTVGEAADFKVAGVSAAKVQQMVEQLMDQGKILKGGIGLGKTFTHYDIRGKKTKWTY